VILFQRVNSMSSGHRIECTRAKIDLLSGVAASTGDRYADVIGARLWRLAGDAAGFGDWRYVRRALALTQQLGYRFPREEHWAVRWSALAHPYAAVRVREWTIRAFKPHLRAHMPQARQEQSA
jgi:hypothetical protein